jgi:hypothetical protein
MTALEVLTLAGVVVNLLLLVRLWADMRVILKHLGHLKRDSRIVIPALWQPHHHHRSLGKGYFALWRWEGSKWKLIMGIVPPGADPGSPPQEPGVCNGETKKVWVASAKP